MLRVRNLGGERVEALEAARIVDTDSGFSPLGRNHIFQSQAHQISDAALIAVALLLSYALRRWLGDHHVLRPTAPLARYAWSYVVILPVAMYLFNQAGLYRNASAGVVRLAWNVSKSVSFAMLAAVGIAYMLKDEVVAVSRVWIVLYAATAATLVVSKHVAWRLYAYRNRSHAAQRRMVALLGAREQNHQIAQRIALHPEWGITVAVELDLHDYSDERLVEALHEHHVECVMLTTGKFSFDRIGQAISVCETEGVDVCLMADFVKPAIARIAFDSFDRRPVLLFSSKPDRAWHLLVKRAIDLAGGAVTLLILGPLVMLPVAIAIKLTSEGPIFFRQLRCGLHGKTFTMLKFRSMVADAEALQSNLVTLNEQNGPVFKMRRDPRVTALGRFIRKTSIDELPQLFNVLRGDMSLVGPRPPIPAEVKKYAAWQRRRLSMKPGLTCLWQVSGRSRIKFEEWMRLDLAYIDSWSLGLDFQILLKTLPAVIAGDGAS
jgi:exopolysaccharide biosynthesis polyprenyl glycosylphosphotransferase